MPICYIFASLPFGPLPSIGPGDFVIAADAGYRQLRGVKPDLVVGDFDSLGFVPEHETVVRHPVRKDDTDTLLAVKLGLAQGYRQFVILGGIGGRLDHTVANIQTLAYLAGQGAKGCLVGEKESALLLQNGSVRFAPEQTGAISVFAFGESASGVTEEGLDYPLESATLACDCPLGVSNAFTGAPARIAVKRGSLLIVWNGRPDKTDYFD
jgi:thiamine pyrophosphokinase